MKLDLSGIKAIIFDMDGTMIDNMDYHRQAWQEFCLNRGIKLSDNEFNKKLSGKKNDEYFKVLFNQKFTETQIKEMAEEKEFIYRKLYENKVEEIKGLTIFLKKIMERKIICAIATTSPIANREMILNKLQLHPYFSVIFGDEDVINGKPNPEIYLKTIKKLKVDPKNCLVFEDSPAGVQSAKSAGVLTIVALLSSHSQNELIDANYFVKDYTEIEI